MFTLIDIGMANNCSRAVLPNLLTFTIDFPNFFYPRIDIRMPCERKCVLKEVCVNEMVKTNRIHNVLDNNVCITLSCMVIKSDLVGCCSMAIVCIIFNSFCRCAASWGNFSLTR